MAKAKPSGLPKGVDQRGTRFRGRFIYRGKTYSQEFDSPRAAEAWIARTRAELIAGTYLDPETLRPPTDIPMLREYAERWIADRPLKPRTRSEYTRMLDSLPGLETRLDRITRDDIKTWWAKNASTPATARKHRYELLRAIFNSAVDDEYIAVSPVRIKGAAKSEKRVLPDLPTPAQIAALADAMPSEKYRVMVLVAAWCGLRFGELTELRRRDITPAADVIKVRRGVTRVDGHYIVGDPKSEAGKRDVAVPPHVQTALAAYLATLPSPPSTLLFPGSRNGRHMAPSSLYKPFYAARTKAGTPELRWHDLRHFAATAAARAGATLAELQARLGHSTVDAALRYQQAARGRDAEIASRLTPDM